MKDIVTGIHGLWQDIVRMILLALHVFHVTWMLTIDPKMLQNVLASFTWHIQEKVLSLKCSNSKLNLLFLKFWNFRKILCEGSSFLAWAASSYLNCWFCFQFKKHQGRILEKNKAMQVFWCVKSCFLCAAVCEFIALQWLFQFTYYCKEENIKLKEMRVKCLYSFPVWLLLAWVFLATVELNNKINCAAVIPILPLLFSV